MKKSKKKEWCVLCSREANHHHIKTKGAGGSNEAENILPLCWSHHSILHIVGWNKFLFRYPYLCGLLKQKGWVLKDRFGVTKLVRE